MTSVLTVSRIQVVRLQLATLGWEVKILEVNQITGQVDFRIERSDGRWAHVRREASGKAVVEYWHRYIVNGKPKGRTPTFACVEDVFMRREKHDGFRSALRTLSHYVSDNTAGLTVGRTKAALAPVANILIELESQAQP